MNLTEVHFFHKILFEDKPRFQNRSVAIKEQPTANFSR